MPTEQILRVLFSGAIFGLGGGLLLLRTGRVPGFSGIVAGVIDPSSRDRAWRIALLAGVVLVAAIGSALDPQAVSTESGRALPGLAIAGLLVGFGTRLGNGCTSGHGICGLGRTSRRSVAATATFFAVAFVTYQLFALTEEVWA